MSIIIVRKFKAKKRRKLQWVYSLEFVPRRKASRKARWSSPAEQREREVHRNGKHGRKEEGLTSRYRAQKEGRKKEGFEPPFLNPAVILPAARTRVPLKVML